MLYKKLYGNTQGVLIVAIDRSCFCSFNKESIMKKLQTGVTRFMQDEEGVTAIEYGLIASLIAVVIIVAVQLVGTNLTAVFNYIAGKLTTP